MSETAPSSEPHAALNDAQSAIEEIDAAANAADAHLKAVSGVLPGVVIPQVEATSEVKDPANARQDRAKFYAQRAENQKKRGRAQLIRTYVGALSMQKDLKVYDVNIASSAERFIGLIDLAIYTLQRRGAPILGVADTEGLLSQIEEMAAKYAEAAQDAKVQAETLYNSSREQVFDGWMEPTYTSAALEAQVHVKSPVTAKLVLASMNWDRAINLLSILQWNGKADSAQCAQLKAEERRSLSAIFRFAARSLQGLRNKSNREAPAPRASTPKEAESAVA